MKHPAIRRRRWVAWVVQSVKCPTLDFSSGHNLTVCEIEPPFGVCTDASEPVWETELLRCPRTNFIFEVLLFNKYILKNYFGTDSDSSDGFGQSKRKTFWKGHTVPNAIKDIHDSWEEVKISM